MVYVYCRFSTNSGFLLAFIGIILNSYKIIDILKKKTTTTKKKQQQKKQQQQKQTTTLYVKF